MNNATLQASPLVSEQNPTGRQLSARPARRHQIPQGAALDSQIKRSQGVTKVGLLVYEYVVRTHVWVASAVTSLTAFACARLGLGTDQVILAIVFLSTLLIYNLDTALDLKQACRHQTSHQHSIPTSTVARKLRAQWLAAFALLTLGVGLYQGRPETALLVLTGASVGCLYAVPLGNRQRRLKAFPGSKSVVVGGAVAIAAVSVPLAEHGASWSSTAWSTLLWLATLTVSNATLFDVRDFDQDSARGLKTLVVLLGVPRVRVALVFLLSASFALLGSTVPSLATPSLWLWLLMVPLTLFLRPSSPRAVFALVLDGALFLPWLYTLSS